MKVIPLFKNDSRLIEKAAKQNRRAQQHLYERYSGKMLSVCRMYIKDLYYAEEVMLAGFFKVFTNLHSFRGEGSFEGWVRRIMIREAISFLRSHKKLDFREGENGELQSFNDGESGLEVAAIQQHIDSLPEGYRAVFVMYAIEGYKHNEIATLLNISEGTSKSQLFKARKMLQERLKTETSIDYGTI